MTVQQDDRQALALQALAEVTDPASVGELLEAVELEPGVRNLVFASRLPGYVGWRWTVSTAQVGDAEPTVLEVELLPGDGALLAPPWVPWAERLAEYRRTHPDEPEPGADDESDDELDEDDDEVDDADDVLDIDGVEFEDAGDEDDDTEVDAPEDAEDVAEDEARQDAEEAGAGAAADEGPAGEPRSDIPA